MKVTKISLDYLVPKEIPEEFWGSIRFHVSENDMYMSFIDIETHNRSESTTAYMPSNADARWEQFLDCIIGNIINVIKENENDAHFS